MKEFIIKIKFQLLTIRVKQVTLAVLNVVLVSWSHIILVLVVDVYLALAGLGMAGLDDCSVIEVILKLQCMTESPRVLSCLDFLLVTLYGLGSILSKYSICMHSIDTVFKLYNGHSIYLAKPGCLQSQIYIYTSAFITR
jgi:hypothetical protein